MGEVGGGVVNAVMYPTEREEGGSGRGLGESTPRCDTTGYTMFLKSEVE